jgi:hypothetical protein
MGPEHLERRCPRLGGDVSFAYCRTCEEEQNPCFKVIDCWWERFDVVAHMQACLSPEAFAVLATRRPPPSKVASLVDLIRQARERTSKA